MTKLLEEGTGSYWIREEPVIRQLVRIGARASANDEFNRFGLAKASKGERREKGEEKKRWQEGEAAMIYSRTILALRGRERAWKERWVGGTLAGMPGGDGGDRGQGDGDSRAGMYCRPRREGSKVVLEGACGYE
jgi:hypothetical protein